MIRARSPIGFLCALVAAGIASACGGDGGAPAPTAPQPVAPTLAFEPQDVSFGEARSRAVTIRNTGTVAAGPVSLVPAAVKDAGGGTIPGASLRVTPSEVPTLNAGASRTLALELDLPAEMSGGEYGVGLEARVDGVALASLGLAFSVSPPGGGTPVGSIAIDAPTTQPQQGEVVRFSAEVRDPGGSLVSEPDVDWTVQPAGSGLVTADGRFVAYVTGGVQLVARAQGAEDTVQLTVAARQRPQGQFQVVGNGAVTHRYTSDHWESGPVAYTGTWSCRSVGGGACGNALLVWDISGEPTLVDSVIVDARVVNDVKVSADGRLAILTHENSNDLQNGITLLDLADPLQPVEIGRFTAPDLTPGVHNVWIEGDYAYVVVDGTSPASGLRVLDISDPAAPVIVSSFYGGASFLHDVYVRDGLAFLSHWSEGLIILDVGNGIAGGSPTSPRQVGKIRIPGYLVHNAWYWPESGYVFLGDEINTPGRVRVIDVRDPSQPVEVASITRVGAAPHNFWIDEQRGIGYFAWYEAGVQAFDVRGELLGQLERQDRRIAGSGYAPGGACVTTSQQCAWAPQLHDGRIYVSDMNTGLWVLDPQF